MFFFKPNSLCFGDDRCTQSSQCTFVNVNTGYFKDKGFLFRILKLVCGTYIIPRKGTSNNYVKINETAVNVTIFIKIMGVKDPVSTCTCTCKEYFCKQSHSNLK